MQQLMSKAASNEFINNLKGGKFIKEILPNSFEDYSIYYEDADLESYRKYIKTFTYLDSIAIQEVSYYGE